MDHGIDRFREIIRGFHSPAILFSGGLDSSIIAFLAEEPKLYTLCYSEESHDFTNAEKSAHLLNLNFEPVFFSFSDVVEALNELKRVFDDVSSVDVAHYLLAGRIREKEALSGQGADELFLGYAKYTRMSVDEKVNRARKDFERWISEDREKRIFARFGKEIIFPYLALKDLAFSLPLEEREGKKFLRSLVLSLGMPEEIALQRKKAMQYGSGVDKVVKKLSASSLS